MQNKPTHAQDPNAKLHPVRPMMVISPYSLNVIGFVIVSILQRKEFGLSSVCQRSQLANMHRGVEEKVSPRIIVVVSICSEGVPALT